MGCHSQGMSKQGVSQQWDVTAKGCQVNGVSQQRDAKAMGCQSKGVSQQRDVKAKGCQSNGMSKQRDVKDMGCHSNGCQMMSKQMALTFSFWGSSRTKVWFLTSPPGLPKARLNLVVTVHVVTLTAGHYLKTIENPGSAFEGSLARTLHFHIFNLQSSEVSHENFVFTSSPS